MICQCAKWCLVVTILHMVDEIVVWKYRVIIHKSVFFLFLYTCLHSLMKFQKAIVKRKLIRWNDWKMCICTHTSDRIIAVKITENGSQRNRKCWEILQKYKPEHCWVRKSEISKGDVRAKHTSKRGLIEKVEKATERKCYENRKFVWKVMSKWFYKTRKIIKNRNHS